MPKKSETSSENYKKALPKKTFSLCPTCLKKIPAIVFEKDGKVLIEKTCKEHGKTTEVYFSDVEMYERFRRYGHTGGGVSNPNTKSTKNCPFDCGLCSNHKSHTALLNLAVTNRCDLRCWYCFYYAKEGDKIFEPTLEEIKEMLETARKEKPVAPVAVQLTGGNPELREDLPEIIKMCKDAGFSQIQLNTQGTHKLQNDPEFINQIKSAGCNTLYLSFDGVSKKTNSKNHWEIPYIFENLRKTTIGTVLVPTVINGVNDHELGDIVNFALNNPDIVRGVNFQPASLVGRMPRGEREKQRITIPEVISKLEKQTNGSIQKSDFYPIPVVTPLTRFVEAITGKPQYLLSPHFACGAATYLFSDGKKVVPITQFIDVDGLFEYLDEKSDELEGGARKRLVAVKLLTNISKFVDSEKEPKNLNLVRLLRNILITHNRQALGELQNKSLFIGMMHFMDLYNYDIERVQRCCIHYVMPDKRIVPFCTFNVLPEIYRDKVQEKFSIPSETWEKQSGEKLKDIVYQRDAKKLEDGAAYKKTYKNLTKFFG